MSKAQHTLEWEEIDATIRKYLSSVVSERDKLREVNKELLEALEIIANGCGSHVSIRNLLSEQQMTSIARAAIARAKGE